MSSLQIEERTLLKRFDMNLIFVILGLNIIGLINLYSATHGADTVGWDRTFLLQLAWVSLGWFLFFVFSLLDYKNFYKLSYILFALNVAALAAVPFIGKSFYGAKRWLDLGFFKYQPSETMKFVLVLVLAKYFSTKSFPNGLGLKHLLFPLSISLIPFALTVKQPDLGTALMLLAIAFSMILFIGIKKSVLISSVIVATIVIPTAWNYGLKDYQKRRVLTFIDPNQDPQGAGYNSIQSKIAVGSGKFFGKGFRKGTQSQLDFLPERHTDFIFSVLSEEHGFVGSITTLALFFILLLIGIKTAAQARDKYGALITVGCMSIIFWHMFINIGMVIGLLPIVGIPLPILSYGGSSMITTMLCLGLISSVSMRKYIF